MYTDNSSFVDAFKSYFSDKKKFYNITNTNTLSLINYWEKLNGDVRSFFACINVYDKIKIYAWIRQNAMLFTHNLKIIQEYKLDKDTCITVFGEDSDKLWKIWESCGKNPEKFISTVTVKDKICLSLWTKDDEE